MKIRLISLSLAFISLAYSLAQAAEVPAKPQSSENIASTNSSDEVVIEGDKLQVQLDRRFKSIGNAALHREKQDIYGDSIEYDVQNQELFVIGNARLEFQGSTITGPALRMKLDDNTGEMKDASFKMKSQFTNLPQMGVAKATDALNKGYVDPNDALVGATQQLSSTQALDNDSYTPSLGRQTGNSRGNAEEILFEGQDRKHLKNARYTTCSADSDDWYIKAKDLELDDYTKTGTATHARVEFMGLPILYTPWINFSFVNQRKSGLLAPTWGATSRSGFEILTPFYWNIAPDMDATFATRYLSKRGLQYQAELRYIGETYSGINNVEYLEKDINTERARYYAKLKHDQNWGNGWTAGYNLEKVSDDKYFSEMTTRITATSRVNLPQAGFVSYTGDVWQFNALVQKYQHLQNTSSSVVTSAPYEKLPQLTLSGNDDFGPFNANLYTQWVSFDRDQNNPKVITTDNGGLLTTSVTGNRMTAYPSVSLPMAQPYGYITPKIGVHYTSYGLDNPEYNLNGVNGSYQPDNRTLPIMSVDSGLFFDRKVRVVKNSYTQTLEPRLFYVYIPYKDQSMLPVFDTAQSDLSMNTLFLENQFTGNDRVNNANQLSLAVTSRMIDSRTGEQRMAATVGQRFYFADQKVGVPGATLRTGDSSDIITAVTARLLNKWNIDAAYQYNTDTAETIKSNIGARYSPELGKVFNLSYRYTQTRLEQINVSGQWPLGSGFYGLGRWNYSLKEGQPIEGLAGLEYDAGCWQARTVMQRVSTATANANYALFFQLELGGLASIGSNPLTLLKRGIPGYTSSGLIPDSNQQLSYE
ncbi:LPS biosynthesis protein [Methylovorus sp. MM2]|uniref:LPS-assembly protein LptD n=1 Tax=Methylovorus sp. MM2 TaxID=1848038 RepID=UPI0007E09502|nr:LPS-assembly protein LptD [Methylovorus sp. MM2]OAM51416.1 LPS biosynthesis protein [Methylovorus sp. MM2]